MRLEGRLNGSKMIVLLKLARTKFGIPPPPYVCDLWSHMCFKDTIKARPRIFLVTFGMPLS